MDNETIKEFCKPFLNISQYLHAIQVVHTSYSEKLRNYSVVQKNINKLVGVNLPLAVVTSFVQQVLNYRHESGMQFFDNAESFSAALNRYSTEDLQLF